MNLAASYRRRFAVGLLLAAALGVGLTQWVLVRARDQESRAKSERVAVVSVNALVEIVERAGIVGDGVRRAVAAVARDNPMLTGIRVVVFEGFSLEASTMAGDSGESAAPRRLTRDEKPLYDQGQRLRAAVETNRQEGAARKPEIEIETAANGGLALAAPLEKDGAVVGFVAAETAAMPPPPRSSWLVPLGAVVVPALVFLVLALPVGERRSVLAVVAAILLLATMVAYGRYALNTATADRRLTARTVAAEVTAEMARASGVTRELSLGDLSALHPASWDTDVFRRPLGLIAADGSVQEAPLEQGLARVAARTREVVGAFTLLALGLLAFVGLGGAARLGGTLRKHRQAYAYTFPAVFGMLALVFLPFLYGVVLSFTDFSLYTSQAPLSQIWIGLKNFTDILGDFHIATRGPGGLVWNYQNIYWTLGVTIVWTVTNVAYGVGMGLFLALILNTKGLFARPIYRVIFILPWATPNYITALIWKGMFHQQFGVINQIIQMLGGTPVSWFEKPGTSLFACIATNAWLSVPFMMVISLGALQSISADLYEAARVDGATRWQQFRSITLPSLKPALIPAMILSVIWTFNMFNIIYLVSAGEPAHSTEILITQAYKFAFEQYRYGYAAAYSMVIFAVLLAYGIWQNKVTKATEGI
ncbi:MAG TPA: sugar ABC transporter permease [Thermoanaerobaculaceae bacterium]|nr:sugar ABC transporter permease [Thermoanaerobaculaceae bacterium]